MKHRILNLLGLAILFNLSGTIALAANKGLPDLSGSYNGTLKDGDDVDLLLRPIPGREGSYLGVMIRLDPKVVIYRIDPLGASTYAMNPLQVTEDGEVGVNNDDPSLVLTLGATRDSAGRPEMTITNANSSNQSGFHGPIFFQGNTYSKLTWTDYVPGYYRNRRVSNELNLSPMNAYEAAISSSADGGLVIREKVDGVFTLKRVSVTSTGAQVESYPNRIGIFVTKSGFFGEDHLFVLVSPQQDSDVELFYQKN